jgi:hypothetical protein
MYTALLSRYHRPGEARPSSNGQHDPPAPMRTPSGVEPPLRHVRDEEEDE